MTFMKSVEEEAKKRLEKERKEEKIQREMKRQKAITPHHRLSLGLKLLIAGIIIFFIAPPVTYIFGANLVLFTYLSYALMLLGLILVVLGLHGYSKKKNKKN